MSHLLKGKDHKNLFLTVVWEQAFFADFESKLLVKANNCGSGINMQLYPNIV